jgi:hypothetical protein
MFTPKRTSEKAEELARPAGPSRSPPTGSRRLVRHSYSRAAHPSQLIVIIPVLEHVAQALLDLGIVPGILTHGFAHQLGPYEAAFQRLSVLLTKWLFLYFLYRQRIFLKA